MDIVTHALMGLALAGPLLPTAPVTAGCFVIGSVLPDVDALARCVGKRAFLRIHQTYSHGLPFAAVAAGVARLVIPREFGEPFAPLALAAGIVLHAALDVTNTYGTAVLAPFSRRRFCTEWVFFIDAFVVAATVAVLVLPYVLSVGAAAAAVGYAIMLAGYWAAKAVLRARAGRQSPADTLSLIPSALVPWRYFGCADRSGEVLLFRINALTGRLDEERRIRTHDAAYGPLLSALPDYRMMREVSPVYRVTATTSGPNGTTVTCRDLRIRNFGGRFGELTVTLSPSGHILRSHLNV